MLQAALRAFLCGDFGRNWPKLQYFYDIKLNLQYLVKYCTFGYGRKSSRPKVQYLGQGSLLPAKGTVLPMAVEFESASKSPVDLAALASSYHGSPECNWDESCKAFEI